MQVALKFCAELVTQSDSQYPSTRSVRSGGGLRLPLASDWVLIKKIPDYIKTSQPIGLAWVSEN